jgi:hypothetical protein
VADDIAPQPELIGFDNYIVFTMDGEFNPATPNPDVPGCGLLPTFCDGDFFWSEILGATPSTVITAEKAAEDFFNDRFGLDVGALAHNGSIFFVNLYFDPRANYRVRTMAGQSVHKYGWQVHDQAYLVITLTQLELGGEFEGLTVPPGTVMAHGRYLIEASDLIEDDATVTIEKSGETFLVQYRTGSPIIPQVDPRMPGSFKCEIYDSPWGTGVAQGVGSGRRTANGLVKQGTRNVLTFGGLGGDGLGSYPGVFNDPNVTVIP